MDYLYAAMWLAAAILLGVFAFKYHRFLYVLSAYFLFLATWWFCSAWFNLALFSGIYATILRIISAVVLAVILFFYYRLKKKGRNESS